MPLKSFPRNQVVSIRPHRQPHQFVIAPRKHCLTVRRWIDEAKIPSIRMPGGQIRIRTCALTKYL